MTNGLSSRRPVRASGPAASRLRVAAVAACAALALAGCRIGYVARLAVEEARYLAAARPVEEWRESAADPELAAALDALVAARGFAESRGLSVGGSYREVVDTGASAPAFVVTAAYADRLAAYTWWYPVVGSVPYRGYFDRPSAERYAAKLAAKGLDTRIVEAAAYSTLGWFDDPLPSSVLERGAAAVVVTVLHELVHQTYFAPGSVAFNETLATAASYRLAEDFYRERGEEGAAERAVAARRTWLARGAVLDDGARRLTALFELAARESWPRPRLLEERARVYAEIVAEAAAADPAFAQDLASGGLDNASFLAVYRYATRAAAVDRFLASRAGVVAALGELKERARRGQDPFAYVEEATAAPAN